jgi:hypothetical protein
MWSGRLEPASDAAMVHGSANRVARGLIVCSSRAGVAAVAICSLTNSQLERLWEDRALLEVTAFDQVHPEQCPPEDRSGGPPKPAGRRRSSSSARKLALGPQSVGPFMRLCSMGSLCPTMTLAFSVRCVCIRRAHAQPQRVGEPRQGLLGPLAAAPRQNCQSRCRCVR